jgi:hypothetical protein
MYVCIAPEGNWNPAADEVARMRIERQPRAEQWIPQPEAEEAARRRIEEQRRQEEKRKEEEEERRREQQ